MTIVGNKGTYIVLDDVEYEDDIKSITMPTEDKDDLTFGQARRGEVKDAKLTVTAIQDMAPGGLWRLLMDNPAGEWETIWSPSGEDTATVDNPHIVGTIKATGIPATNQEARSTRERDEFEYEFEWIDGPRLDDGTG